MITKEAKLIETKDFHVWTNPSSQCVQVCGAFL